MSYAGRVVLDFSPTAETFNEAQLVLIVVLLIMSTCARRPMVDIHL